MVSHLHRGGRFVANQLDTDQQSKGRGGCRSTRRRGGIGSRIRVDRPPKRALADAAVTFRHGVGRTRHGGHVGCGHNEQDIVI